MPPGTGNAETRMSSEEFRTAAAFQRKENGTKKNHLVIEKDDGVEIGKSGRVSDYVDFEIGSSDDDVDNKSPDDVEEEENWKQYLVETGDVPTSVENVVIVSTEKEPELVIMGTVPETEDDDTEEVVDEKVMVIPEMSSNDPGSSKERVLAYSVVARILTSPKNASVELILPQIDENGKLKRNEGRLVYGEAKRYDLNMDLLKDDREGETFKALVRYFWKDLATHGLDTPNGLSKYSDADGELCLELMKRAGIKNDTDKEKNEKFRKNKVEFVPKGMWVEDKMTMDSGGINGVFLEAKLVEKNGEKKWVVTVRVDHHGIGDGASPSAAKDVYESLVNLGLLEGDRDNFKQAVGFLNKVDEGQIPGTQEEIKKLDLRKFFKEIYAKTFYGLENFISGKDILTFFGTRGRALTPMTLEQRDNLELKSFYPSKKAKKNEQLKKVEKAAKINEYVEDVQDNVDNSIVMMERLIASDCVLESKKYGRILVDIGSTVPLTGKAARFWGFDGYVGYNPEKNFFQVVNDNKIEFSLGDGIKKRNWLGKKDKEPMKIGLREIVNKLIGDEGRVGVGVLEYLKENEKKETTKETIKSEAAVPMKEIKFRTNDEIKIEEQRAGILEMLSGLKEPIDDKKLQYLKENLSAYSGDNVKTLNAVIDMYLHPEKRKMGLYLWSNKAEPILRFLGLKVV